MTSDPYPTSAPNAIDSEKYDLLARTLIADYWHEFLYGSTWNYRTWWPKYLPGDTWATSEKWIAMAQELLLVHPDCIAALEVLLCEGLMDEFLPVAMRLTEGWFRESKHDPEYFVDLIAFFPPDHEIRRFYFEDMDEFLSTGTWAQDLRKALVRVGDAKACTRIAGVILSKLNAGALEFENFETEIMTRLVDLGPLASKYMPPEDIMKIKQLCRDYLRFDQEFSESGKTALYAGDDGWEQSLWVRDKIAVWAFQLDWKDILVELLEAPWYWREFSSDRYFDLCHENLLCWSCISARKELFADAIKVMESEGLHQLDGAIAWCRLRKLVVD